MPPLENYSSVKYRVDREALMIRRSLNIQIKNNDVKQQMKNIFHIRCYMSNKLYSMIDDKKSCYTC